MRENNLTIAIDKYYREFLLKPGVLFILLLFSASLTFSQDTTVTKEGIDKRPVRSPFESGILIENQTIVIPPAKTFEFVMQHRFGEINDDGDFDLFGIYGHANIRLGFNYVPIENIQIGFGSTKNNLLQDFNVKWAILKQTRSGSMPIAITYYGNMVIDARKKENFTYGTDRFSYFHQIIIARKFNDVFSFQVAPSLSHYNAVYSYMKNDNFAIAFGGRIKFSPKTAIILEYDQPFSNQEQNDPKPNLSLGIEIGTTSHVFQVFIGSYKGIINQRNTMFNTNDFTNGDLLIGFNITRLWNF